MHVISYIRQLFHSTWHILIKSSFYISPTQSCCCFTEQTKYKMKVDGSCCRGGDAEMKDICFFFDDQWLLIKEVLEQGALRYSYCHFLI